MHDDLFIIDVVIVISIVSIRRRRFIRVADNVVRIGGSFK